MIWNITERTMEDKNVKQKEFWSGAGGDVWVNKQKEMDIMLNPLGQRAIDKLDLSNGREYRYRMWLWCYHFRNCKNDS